MRAIDRLIELDESESAAQRERLTFLNFIDAVIEALPDGLIVADSEGKIILFNERAEFMFGRHRSEVVGQALECLLPEQSRSLHIDRRHLYNQFGASAGVRSMGLGMQLTGLRSDGQEFPVDITLARMVVARGVFNLALVRYAPGLIELVATQQASPGEAPETPGETENFDARH